MSILKLAYGTRDDIQPAINSGKIPPGSLIYTKSGEIFFYDLEGNLSTYKEKNKFTCKEDAEEYVSKYHCHGEVLSVLEGDKYCLYVVGYDDKLEPVNNTSSTEGDKHYVYIQRSASDSWDIVHNLNKYPSVTVVDSANNIVVGEVNYISLNEVIIKFIGTFSGKAFLN